jgi:hypothetical protein
MGHTGRVRGALTIATLLLVGGSACSSSTDAGLSLCTRERDPLGSFCVDGLSSAAGAERTARGELEGGGALVAVESGPLGSLNVDGLDEIWRFSFFQPSGPQVVDVEVNVVDETTTVTTTDGSLACEPGEYIVEPDSRERVRAAVLAYEDERGRFRMGDDGHLVYQHRLTCASPTGGLVHHVAFRLTTDPLEYYFVRLVDDEPTAPCGPCAEAVPAACAACP